MRYLLILLVLLHGSTSGAFGKEPLSKSQSPQKAASKYPPYWPPALNHYYPGLELMSLSGQKVSFASFAGKVLLIEPIGMTCPGCQAYVGGHRKGGFGGVAPQPGVESMDEMLLKNGISPLDKRLQRIQLILYSMSMQVPTQGDARKWADHFGFGRASNETLLIGDSRLINSASYNMIPGFQLVDQNFVLQSDSTGHNPKSDLYAHLIPTLKKLLP